MPIRPSEFLATIAASKSFARPNLFRVEVFPPEGLKIDTTTLKHLSINCKSSAFPGKTLETQLGNADGYIGKLFPFTISYAPISIVFNLSGDHREKKFFEEWMKMAYNETTNTLNYYDEFIGTVIISQLNRRHEVTKSYQLFEAFPLALNEVQVAQDTENSISELSVSIGYRKYKDLT